MIVCIAEKPSVAKDIAHVLGANQQRDGYMEGNGYQVTWTFGHLCELKDPAEYQPRWKKWDIWDLPLIPNRYGIRLKEDEGIKKQFSVIQRLMSEADGIINCGDAGQEGELIQRWVMQKAGAKCPVKRLWISSLTEESITEGFRTLKDQSEYQSLYEAGLSRAIGDWTLGINATRLYTMKYGQNKQVLSIGRVQTPTLALIVSRQSEIENFVPRQSWILSTLFGGAKFSAVVRDEDAEAEMNAEMKDSNGNEKKSKPKGPIYRLAEYATEEECRRVLESVENRPFVVDDVQNRKGVEYPPRLYDLTSLQVDCNRKFGFSADQTLQIIQSLYEKKFTTYPRVDTTYLPDDIYSKCPGILEKLRGYEKFTECLKGTKLRKSKKTFDSSKVTDHHAIIPTGVPAVNLTDFEKHVYDLVTRAFIAAFYPDCVFTSMTVLGSVTTASDDKVIFRAGGRAVVDDGWKVLYKKAADETQAQDDEDGAAQREEQSLPAFKKGDNGDHVPSMSDKWTQPPKYYTEATLLRAMETAGRFVDDEELRDLLKENGIGRPSTRAAIIETLFKRRYIRKERKNLIATPTGVELIGLIHEELLKSAELTGQWEKKLRDIERKSYSAKQFIDELKQMVTDLIYEVRSDNSKRTVTVLSDEDIKKKVKSTRKSVRKSDVQTPTGQGKEEKDSVNSDAVPAGFQPRKSTKTRSVAKDVEAIKASYNPDDMIGMPCPKCKTGVIVKGKTAYGCSRWREGCDYRELFNA